MCVRERGVCVCVCVCTCVRERERERGVCVCLCVSELYRRTANTKVCMQECDVVHVCVYVQLVCILLSNKVQTHV